MVCRASEKSGALLFIARKTCSVMEETPLYSKGDANNERFQSESHNAGGARA